MLLGVAGGDGGGCIILDNLVWRLGARIQSARQPLFNSMMATLGAFSTDLSDGPPKAGNPLIHVLQLLRQLYWEHWGIPNPSQASWTS